jgi:hypothetical protein
VGGRSIKLFVIAIKGGAGGPPLALEFDQQRGASNGAGLSLAFNPAVLPPDRPWQFKASLCLTPLDILISDVAAAMTWINFRRSGRADSSHLIDLPGG